MQSYRPLPTCISAHISQIAARRLQALNVIRTAPGGSEELGAAVKQLDYNDVVKQYDTVPQRIKIPSIEGMRASVKISGRNQISVPIPSDS